MLRGKVYVLWNTGLISAAMRHKNLTFDVLGLEFAQRVFWSVRRRNEEPLGPGRRG